MKKGAPLFAAVCVALSIGSAALAQKPSAAPTDVYVVSFFKAAPGQAAALLTTLQQPDPKNPMAGHLLLLRHAQGSDGITPSFSMSARRRPSVSRHSPTPVRNRHSQPRPGTPIPTSRGLHGKSSRSRWEWCQRRRVRGGCAPPRPSTPSTASRCR